MQTILVPTDFSQQARNAASHAAEIAKLFNAKLVLFHAYMLPTPVSEVPYVMVTVDELQKDNENLIKSEAEKLNQRYGVEVEWMVRIGIPSDEIRTITEEKQIDMVVMGMKGVGGIDKIIGSTTVNSIRKTDAPVLVIPQDARVQHISQITFATDLHFEIVVQTFDTLRKLASVFNAAIEIVHVRKPGHDLSIDIDEWRKQLSEVLERPELRLQIVEDSNVQHGINEFINRNGSQLLVMIAQKHSFFDRLFGRSETSSMAYETRIPLLILHQKG